MQLESPFTFSDSPYSDEEREKRDNDISPLQEYTKAMEALEPEQRVAAGIFTVAMQDLKALSKPMKDKRKKVTGGSSGNLPLASIRWFLTNPDGGELLATTALLNKNIDFIAKFRFYALPLLEIAEQTNPHLAHPQT